METIIYIEATHYGNPEIIKWIVENKYVLIHHLTNEFISL
jgi:hypothetical protein